MVVSEFQLYNLLKAKIGEKEAEAFVEILEKKVDEKFSDAKQHLATKEDLAHLKTRMEIGFRQNLQWTVATIIGSAGIIIAAVKLLH